MKFISLATMLLLSVLGFAQKPPIKFGDVSIEDLKMEVYPSDSSAEAVVLADYGESAILYDQNDGFYVLFDRTKRIKILTKEGLDFANFSIPLYHSGTADEKLSSLKAVTYNLENGKIVETKMKSEGVIKENYDSNIDFMKVVLPNVKEGSVVEITYKVRSDFLFNFQDWDFQSTIPVVWSEYRARMPEYFNYDKYMQGYIALDVSEEKKAPGSIVLLSKERSGSGWQATKTTFSSDKIEFQEHQFRWVAKNVPAFKPEPFITTPRDYISRINFELAFTRYPNEGMKRYMGSWEDINRQFLESSEFGQEVTGNAFLRKTVEGLTEGLVSPEDKIVAITNYVKQNVNWDGVSRRYVSKTLRKVLEDKRGTSAEVNLLLASMLDKADFTVSPVLLSTRDHGFVREETPISSQFNSVVCAVTVGDKKFLIDATEKLLPIGALPERCINGRGFLVSKGGFQWVPLQSSAKSRTLVNADLSITPDAELKGTLQVDRDGHDALVSRKKFFSKNESEYVKEFVGTRSWEVSKSEFENAKEIGKPLKEKYNVSMRDQMTLAGDMIYFNPILLNNLVENPFKIENREYPVDFGSPFDKVFICRLAIPEGYQIEELPQPKIIALPQGSGKFTYSAAQVGGQINIYCGLQINKSIFNQMEYAGLKEFYNQVVAKEAEQIVFKRK